MSNKKKYIIWTGLIGLIICLCLAFYFTHNEKSTKAPTVIPEEQMVDTNVVQDKLDVKPKDAKEIVTQVKEVYVEKKKPTATFTVATVGSEKPVEVVKEKIASNDTTLPKEALKDTDKTVVATNGTKVDVYKINTYRNWEAGVGIGKLDGETYIPVAIQRNYDRCHSVELQANLDTAGHINGGQVMWKVHF